MMTFNEFNKRFGKLLQLHGELPVYIAEGFKHFLAKSVKVKSNDGIWEDGEGKLLPPYYILISSDEDEVHV